MMPSLRSAAQSARFSRNLLDLLGPVQNAAFGTCQESTVCSTSVHHNCWFWSASSLSSSLEQQHAAPYSTAAEAHSVDELRETRQAWNPSAAGRGFAASGAVLSAHAASEPGQVHHSNGRDSAAASSSSSSTSNSNSSTSSSSSSSTDPSVSPAVRAVLEEAGGMLRRMGIQPGVDCDVGEGLASIPLGIFVQGSQVSLEVEDDTSRSPNRAVSYAQQRTRTAVLKANGWLLAQLPLSRWTAAPDAHARQHLLLEVLKSALAEKQRVAAGGHVHSGGCCGGRH